MKFRGCSYSLFFLYLGCLFHVSGQSKIASEGVESTWSGTAVVDDTTIHHHGHASSSTGTMNDTYPQSGGTLYLNLICHQHQPLYLDPETDQLQGPWVRTHGTKDYYDMASILEK